MFGCLKKKKKPADKVVEEFVKKPKTDEMPPPSTPVAPNKTRVLEVISFFETSSRDGFAQATGNFDGYWLTCGILGFTMRSGSQQPLVKEFISSYGRDSLTALMPRSGEAYIRAVYNNSSAKGIVTKWSKGRSKYRLHEPYESELKALWGSPGMVDIQLKACESRFDWSIRTAEKDFGSTSFNVVLSYFDYLINNGGMKKVKPREATKEELITKMMRWRSAGMEEEDTYKNIDLLRKVEETEELRRLFGLIIDRCSKSRRQYRAITANRKIICAIGRGNVNNDYVEYDVSGEWS